MKKGLFLITIVSQLLFLSACLDSDDGDDQDLLSPEIRPFANSSNIMPEHFSVVAGEAMSIPLAFEVSDASGISEIVIESHSGFDGHTHGRITNTGEFVLFRYNHVITREALDDPFVFQSDAGEDPTIYLDGRNSFIPDGALVLAGPYHFSIKATDVAGNETSYADNTTHHGTLYIQRDYAPQISPVAIDAANRTVTGSVSSNTANASSSDIVFLWIYISGRNEENPMQEGEISEEWIWGSSNWPHQFRPNTGADLPDHQMIDLSDLLSNEQAVFDMQDNELLTVWAEDANGNISVKFFE